MTTVGELTPPAETVSGPVKVHEYVPPAYAPGMGVAVSVMSAPNSAFRVLSFNGPLTRELVMLTLAATLNVKSSYPMPEVSLMFLITILLIFLVDPKVKPTVRVPLPKTVVLLLNEPFWNRSTRANALKKASTPTMKNVKLLTG